MAAAGPPPTPRPPGRPLLRSAGAFTQLGCGACLLMGTIGLVLVQQNKMGSLGVVSVWLILAMAGLVFGGLIYRGGLVSMLVAAAIDAGFGVTLLVLEYDTLRGLLRILPSSDVDAIGVALDVAGFVMLGAGALCLIALPQGIRYARWFHGAAATRSAMSTARGFPPPPVPARTAAFIIPSEDQPASRRRMYMVLGGMAIGVGAGVGVLVSSNRTAGPGPAVAVAIAQAAGGAASGGAASGGAASGGAASGGTASGGAASGGTASGAGSSGAPGGGSAGAMAPSASLDAGSANVAVGAGGASTESLSGTAPTQGQVENPAPSPAPSETIAQLLARRRTALAEADAAALGQMLHPGVFGFGVDADEVAEGRDAVVTQLLRDLGEPPPGGFNVASLAVAIGEERDHAWIAEELEISGRAPGSDDSGPARLDRRRFAVTELVAAVDGRWQIVAQHWATPVGDATAERLAILRVLPVPQVLPDRHDGPADLLRAVRAAFASRPAFADARSERPDAFNYGSGGERAAGGLAIRRIFTRIKAQIRPREGLRLVAGGAWDPSQKADPWIAWAALNVDFTSRTRAATDVTQTFRVLAILLREGTDWKLVQTQWSNGGPIR